MFDACNTKARLTLHAAKIDPKVDFIAGTAGGAYTLQSASSQLEEQERSTGGTSRRCETRGSIAQPDNVLDPLRDDLKSNNYTGGTAENTHSPASELRDQKRLGSGRKLLQHVYRQDDSWYDGKH